MIRLAALWLRCSVLGWHRWGPAFSGLRGFWHECLDYCGAAERVL